MIKRTLHLSFEIKVQLYNIVISKRFTIINRMFMNVTENGYFYQNDHSLLFLSLFLSEAKTLLSIPDLIYMTYIR